MISKKERADSKVDSVKNSVSDSDKKVDSDKQSKTCNVDKFILEKRGKIIFFSIFCLPNCLFKLKNL